jgi:Uncharacterized protein encoded in hypervariable junctions of pilus gene clusters
MKYKEYEAAIKFDDQTENFHGEVINTSDVLSFHGRSVAELKREFKNTVEDYLEFCEKRGEEPDKPFSGNFILRISPDLHRRLFISAKLQSKSLNSLIEEHLETIE